MIAAAVVVTVAITTATRTGWLTSGKAKTEGADQIVICIKGKGTVLSSAVWMVLLLWLWV